MGINIDGARDLLTATDGSLTIEGQSIHSTGIGTFSGGVKVGSAATIHSTGQFNIGVAATIFANGNATFAGILTAASFSGIDLGAVTGATGDFSIADKIVHTGDTDTAMRFPGADTISFQTGGTERVHIASDGKVGIGTDSPGAQKLELYYGASAFDILSIRSGAGAYGQAGIAFGSNQTHGRQKATIFFQERTGGAHHAGDLCFSVDNASGDAGTAGLAEERLRIQASGHVGIGTSMPTDRAASSNSRILNVGIVTANNVYASTFYPSGRQLGNRRINVNGAMQVWQRSTSASDIGGSNGYFAADRYRSSNNGSGRHTISKDTDTPTGQGFGHSMKIDVTTAVSSPSANNYMFIQYRMEGYEVHQFAKGTSGAKQYALSFWVKSPKTGVHVVQLEDVENSRSVQGAYTIASADTWENHSIIFPAETSNGITCDNAHRMQLYFWLFAGSTYNNGSVGTLGTTWDSTGSISRASGQVNCFDNTSNNFYITGIQLEVGSHSTAFEHWRYDDELIRCQRYFNMIGDGDKFGSQKALSDAFMWGATEVDFMYTFPTEMRTTPSIYQVTGANYFRIQGGGSDTYIDGSFTMQYQTKRSTSQYTSSDSSRTSGASCHITVHNSAARYGYTADL